jgi:hypothetical protein
VASDAAGDDFVVRDVAESDVPQGPESGLDLRVAETIRRALGVLTTRERRCVLSVPASEVVTRTFRVPPGMRRAEAERAAVLEAAGIIDWPESERLVALDPIPGASQEMLLSVARNSSVERLIAIARAGGLTPVAVDVPACAWRRALPNADAVLDYSSDRAELLIFGKPLGTTYTFPPRLIEDRLASQVRAALVEARRDGVADVQRLEILGSRFRFESIAALLCDEGYVISPVTLGGVESPAWTFAYGLSSWSIAPRGLARL